MNLLSSVEILNDIMFSKHDFKYVYTIFIENIKIIKKNLLSFSISHNKFLKSIFLNQFLKATDYFFFSTN